MTARKFALLFSTSLTALAIAGPGLAQTSAPGTLEEVVVTARRVTENLQEAPVSVTAMDAQMLEKKSIEGLEDLAGQVVGFSFENYSGGLGSPTIRGMSQTRLTNPVQNVATFLDGAYLQRAYMLDASLLAMSRVEVVKGPQSALYGRNAFSGAINYVTKDPGETLSGTITSTVGTDKRFDYGLSVDGTIFPDLLRGLVAVNHSQFDGTWENQHALADAAGTLTKGNLGGYDKDSYLAKLVFTPTDKLEFTLEHSKTDVDVEVQPSYSIGTASITNNWATLNCSPLANVGSTTGVQNRLFCGALPTSPPIVAGSQRKAGLVADPRTFGAKGISEVSIARAKYEFTDNFDVTYQFSRTYSNVTSRGGGSYDAEHPTITPAVYATFTAAQKATYAAYIDKFTTDSQPNGFLDSDQHELRFSYSGIEGLRLLGGFNAWKVETAEIAGTEAGTALTTEKMIWLLRFQNLVRTEVGESFFGSAEYAFNDRLKVVGEIRYTDEKQGLNDFTAAAVNRNNPLGYYQTKHFKYTTPRITVDYKLTDDNLVYGSVGKGVKAGGFNGGPYFLASQCPVAPTAVTCPNGMNTGQQFYEPETNWTYEIGSKNELFDRTLRLNVSAYYVDWTNLQITAARNDSGIAAGLAQPTITGNVGGVKVYGVEVEGQWVATQNLRVDYGLSYSHAAYNGSSVAFRFVNAQPCDGTVCPLPAAGGSISGNQLERSPRWEGALGVEYGSEFSNGWTWFARGDLDYRSKQFVDEYNLAWTPGRTLINLRAGVTAGPYSLQGWVKNLFDEEYTTNVIFTLGTGGQRTAGYTPFLGEKRSAGLTVKAEF